MMAEVYCSILHVSNYWLRERILSFLFEKEEIGCDYRRITRLSNSVKIHAVTPYQQTNVESPGQQKPEIETSKCSNHIDQFGYWTCSPRNAYKQGLEK